MVASMACFTLNDALVKLLSATLPIGQIMALRGLLVVVGMVVVLRVLKLRIALPERWTMVRATLEVGVTFCFLTALSRIPLAEATTIFFAAPVIATGLAALVLGERVGPRRWSAVIAGFIGVFIAAGPRGSADPAVLLAFLAAVLSALRDLATRRVPPETGSGTVALVTAGCVTLGGRAGLAAGTQGDTAVARRRRSARRRRLRPVRLGDPHGGSLVRRLVPIHCDPPGDAAGRRCLERPADGADGPGCAHHRRGRAVHRLSRAAAAAGRIALIRQSRVANRERRAIMRRPVRHAEARYAARSDPPRRQPSRRARTGRHRHP
jgi:hypothetical protein